LGDGAARPVLGGTGTEVGRRWGRRGRRAVGAGKTAMVAVEQAVRASARVEQVGDAVACESGKRRHRARSRWAAPLELAVQDGGRRLTLQVWVASTVSMGGLACQRSGEEEHKDLGERA
jgi:hypothetical protein